MDVLISESHVVLNLSIGWKVGESAAGIFIIFLSGALLWNVFEKFRHVTWPFQLPTVSRAAPGIPYHGSAMLCWEDIQHAGQQFGTTESQGTKRWKARIWMIWT